MFSRNGPILYNQKNPAFGWYVIVQIFHVYPKFNSVMLAANEVKNVHHLSFPETALSVEASQHWNLPAIVIYQSLSLLINRAQCKTSVQSGFLTGRGFIFGKW